MQHKRSIMSIAMATIVLLSLCAVCASTSVGAAQAAVGGQSSGQVTSAPLNPAWLAYQKNLTAGKAVPTTTAKGNSLGASPTPLDLSYLKGKRAAGIAATFAASYDLRLLGKVTSVKNQDPYGTCWAFATFGSLESYLLTAETRNFSEYNLATQSGFDGASDLNHGGNAFKSTAYLARWGGPLNEADAPYPGGDVHAASATIQKHTQNVYFLPGRASNTDNSYIKSLITTNGGVYILFYWDDTYASYSPATYYNPTTTSVNHAVTIVGWDDNFAASNFRGAAGAPPHNGAFIVKNSWGTSWGDGGYFYLSYYDTSIAQATAFTAEPTSNYATEYQYDPLGWVTSLGYNDKTAWGANVFTASSSEPLNAVSFYTTDVATQYQIYIYTDPTSGSPIGGTQYVGPSGTTALPGYHTVNLASPIPLSAGQHFSVVIKFTTSSFGYPVATEYAVSGYSSAASASPGQSYVSQDGSAWQDTTTWDSTANVDIQAFTGTQSAQPTAFTIATSTTTPTTNVPFTLTGTLKSGSPLAPLAGQPVHLDRRTGTTGTWATVAGTTKKTNSKGQIQVTQTMSTAGTYQYRWHYIGTATYPQAYSAVVTETVKKPTSIGISTSPTTPKFNQLFTVWGALKSGTTPLAGYYVHLERKIGSGSWATVAGTTKKTGTGGLVFVKQTMTTHHTYYYRWHFTGTATYQPRYSAVKTFTM